MILYPNHLTTSIQEHAGKTPNKAAIVEVSGRTTSFLELSQMVERIAKNLLACGLQKGDRVLFLLRPSSEAVAVMLGVVLAGGVIVTADIAMGAQNFASRVRHTHPRFAIVESSLLALQISNGLLGLTRRWGLEVPLLRDLLAEVTIFRRGTWLPGLSAQKNFRQLLKPNLTPFTTRPGEDLDSQIIFTSGTTKHPTGVVHSPRSFAAIMTFTLEKLQPKKESVFYTNQYYIAFPGLVAGCSVVLDGTIRFNPRRELARLARFQATHYFNVPYKLTRIKECLAHKKTRWPTSLRTLLVGSAPVTTNFLRELFSEIDSAQVTVWCVYGLTEILPATAIEASQKLTLSEQIRGDILGYPLGDVRVWSEEDELVLQGSNQAKRFLLGESIQTVRSGDQGYVTDEGLVVLTGRKKDMIITTHYNVYPLLFEPEIEKIPGVKQAALVGYTNPLVHDEEVVLFLVPETWQGENDDFKESISRALLSAEYSIDAYALPKHIFVLKELPVRGKNLKVDKNYLRTYAQNQLT